MLLILLLGEGSTDPLVIDQPEDDLDNAFVSEGVVGRVREEKAGRQLLFTTHNANLPVLGDAELIVVLQASGEAAGAGRGEVAPDGRGAIDAAGVRTYVESLLEEVEKRSSVAVGSTASRWRRSVRDED